ncbi:hypothetical protein NFI96_007293, partial [Prochilodus magdalenae]
GVIEKILRWRDWEVLRYHLMANATKSSLDVLNTVFVLSSMDLSREGAYATVIIVLPAYIFYCGCVICC